MGKMNGTKAEIDTICSWLAAGPLDPNCEVVVGVPGCYLQYVADKLPKTIGVAAQNCYKVAKGAFTGELAPAMIQDCGAHWVILGHSERRNVFGETDELVGDKVKFALESGLNVLPCIGDKLEEREAGITNEVCFRQLAAIAKNASPEQAQEVHLALRGWLSSNVSPAVAESTRILYGGSVSASNCRQLAACPDIDGSLVGGASLKKDFIEIVNATQ